MKILGDQPIRTKKEDILDRVGFAENIANGILKWKSEESLCAALYGPWGSGKTSVINLCLEAIKDKTKNLQKKNRPVITRFQPWLISGQEQLIKSFLEQLREVLGKPGLSKHARDAAKKLETFEKLLGYVSWVPKVREYVSPAKNAVYTMKKTAESLSQQIEEDLEANKESICKALLNLRSPIIIVIDDVDRLTNQEIRQLFQLIKAVADFPKTIYLLAFDHDIVEKALESLQAGTGTKYLEKIVQLFFEVPNPSRGKITAVLWDGLDTIVQTVSSEKYEQDRWNELKFGPLPALFRNVRDVKRYLNTVNFMYPNIKGEVSSVDLLVVEAIHMFAPSLYRAIRSNKDYLVSDSPRAMSRSTNDKEKDEWINGLPELAPEHCRNEIKEMLSHLFPEVESVFEKHGWGSGFVEKWEKNQRICISSYFDYYFQGSLPEGEVSAKETDRVIKLLNDQSNLTLLLKNYMLDGRITNLLPKVERYIEDNIEEKAIQNFIMSIFESGEGLPPKPHSMFELPFDWAIQGAIYRLLMKLDQSLRKSVLINAMCSSRDTISFPLEFASHVWTEGNPSEGQQSKKPKEEKLLTREEAEEVKEVALTLLRKHKDSPLLYKSRRLLSILYQWEKWSKNEEVREWVKNILSDE